MTKVMSITLAAMFVFGFSLQAENIAELHNLGFVVVSPYGPEDGGDFGRKTPNTQTSGLQEAINFALANKKDVFIIGGGVKEWIPRGDGKFMGWGGDGGYGMSTTLYVPPAENFRIISGIGGTFRTNEEVIVFDSQKNCEFYLPAMMGGSGKKSIVKINPQNPLPDGTTGFTHSIISTLGTWYGGIGLLLDGSTGPIAFNKFHITEANGCTTSLLLEQGDIRSNEFELVFNHAGNYSIVVKTGSYNLIKSLVDVSGRRLDLPPIGVNILGGSQNIFYLTINNGFSKGNAIVFGPDARDNLVYATNLLVNGIANNASVSTNRIVSLKPVGFDVPTPGFPASDSCLGNRSCFTVVATIKESGNVSRWTLTDTNGTNQTVKAPLYTGQLICLEPGDKISFTYSSRPNWKWKALR